MEQVTIMIVGAIGSFKFGDKQINGVDLLDIVSQVNSKVSDKTKSIVFKIASPGGVKSVGDSIYDYIVSLKAKYEITTEQIGDIYSIATKIYGAGTHRIALLDGKSKFMIHNPWTEAQGDSSTMSRVASELKVEEDELKTFYMNLTGVSEEGILPLMRSETFFDAEKAVSLKFATESKTALKIAAYTMNKNEETKVIGLLDSILSLFKKGNTAIVNMAAELEDGTSIEFATEDISKLEGVEAFTMTGEGETAAQVPAPDGVYTLKDGRKVTVASGKVTVVEVAQVEPPADTAAVALAAKIEELTNQIKAQKSEKEEILAAVEKKITDLKSQIKSSHVPPGFKPSDSKTDALAWDTAFKENRIKGMKEADPEQYQRLFFAKYGKMPNM